MFRIFLFKLRKELNMRKTLCIVSLAVFGFLFGISEAHAFDRCDPDNVQAPCWEDHWGTLDLVWQYPEGNAYLIMDDWTCPGGNQGYVIVDGTHPHFNTTVSIALAALLSGKTVKVDYVRTTDKQCHLQSIIIRR
jgi:phage terminase large subunit-like protein